MLGLCSSGKFLGIFQRSFVSLMVRALTRNGSYTKSLPVIMKQTLYILITFFTISSCTSQKSNVEKISFTSEYKINSQIESELAKDSASWKYQVSASEYATKGDYRNALIQWDLAMGTGDENLTEKQIDSISSLYKRLDASKYIIEEAKKNQIVIINEAHHNSFHRLFTKSLLEDLFANGYKFIGFEALSYKDDLDSLQNIRKYPIQKTGYYVKDPQFGNLIREAIEIGFNIFPYETTNEESDGKTREIDQAKNIQKIINENPNQKFIIHCGFDHVLEGTHKSWEKAMAERLKEYSGINPLTINQVAYSEKSKSQYNSPILKAMNITESSVFVDKNNNPLKYQRNDAYADIAVFHPNTEYLDNRPNWLFDYGNENVAISLSNIQIDFPVMVLAYKKGEDLKLAVPIDISEVENRADDCHLGLKKGIYNIVITNGKESVKFEQSVK